MRMIDKDKLLDLIEEEAQAINSSKHSDQSKRMHRAYISRFKKIINRLPEYDRLTGEFIGGIFAGIFLVVFFWACYHSVFVWFD